MEKPYFMITISLDYCNAFDKREISTFKENFLHKKMYQIVLTLNFLSEYQIGEQL